MKLTTQLLPCTALESAPALVLLHGWGLHSAVWQPLLPSLRESFHLTLIDLPGWGANTAVLPQPYSLDSLAEQVLAVAPARAQWLGWSLGGLLALHIAAAVPARVSALSLLACNPCFVQRPDWACAMPAERFAAFQSALREAPAQTLSRFAALQCQGSASARADLRFLNTGLDQQATVAALAGGLDLLARSDLRTTLSALSVPLQCSLGVHDALVPAALAHELQRLKPEADIQLFARSAHLPFISEPQAFLASLQAFSRREAMRP